MCSRNPLQLTSLHQLLRFPDYRSHATRLVIDAPPCPTIEANVGDVLEVRLTNLLPEATTLHWHGLRLPAPMDGADLVQRPVAPGETFTYRFLLSDAGTFWHHPHSNETVRMERGLYGALILRGADELTVDRERVLVRDDTMLDRDGSIVPPGGWAEQRDGQEGQTCLLAGRAEPELTVSAGQVDRWRLVNTSSARYVRLSIGGAPFRILGTGGGLVETPVVATEALLVPGDRLATAEIAGVRSRHRCTTDRPQHHANVCLVLCHEQFRETRRPAELIDTGIASADLGAPNHRSCGYGASVRDSPARLRATNRQAAPRRSSRD